MSGQTTYKYDNIATHFAERSYANLQFDMKRRLLLSMSWGIPLGHGESILELGCGDGYLAKLLIKSGIRYSGIDISPGMVEAAKKALEKEGLKGQFQVGDIDNVSLSEPYDAVVSYMHNFFSYIRDPLHTLKRIRSVVRKKVIIDVNPREIPLAQALSVMEKAGFCNITWRPFFVPKEKTLPIAVLRLMASCETIPVIRSLPLKWKFLVLLMGEVK